MEDIKILHDISYGMYVLTTSLKDKKAGCIINTLSQITSENPTISISVNKNNYTNGIIRESRKFAVSIITEEADINLIGTFGYKTSKEVDKFENVNYSICEDMPVINDYFCGYIICDVINIVECETHDIFIGRVKTMKKLNNDKPMTYKYYHEVLKGSSPKNAPTYQEAAPSEGKYRCKVCGYIYDNSKEKIKFEDLPDDYKCMICGAGKEMFEKL